MSFLLAYLVAKSIEDYIEEPMTRQKSNSFVYVSLPICLFFFGFVFWGIGASLGSLLLVFGAIYIVAFAMIHCANSKEDKQCKPVVNPAAWLENTDWHGNPIKPTAKLAPKLNPLLDKPAPYRYY